MATNEDIATLRRTRHWSNGESTSILTLNLWRISTYARKKYINGTEK